MPLAPQVTPYQIEDRTANRAVQQIGQAVNAILKFLEPYRSQRAWSDLPLHNGWAAFTGTVLGSAARASAPQYNIYPDGTVRLRGIAVQNSGADTVIAQLPTGFRPVYPKIFSIMSGNVVTRLDVIPDGSIILAAGGTPAAYVSLDGVYFEVKP